MHDTTAVRDACQCNMQLWCVAQLHASLLHRIISRVVTSS
jgi:hypothetical protein